MTRLHRDRFRGALLGLAAGDAVGTTVEFREPGTFAPLEDMVGGGPFRLAPGQWTDDTSMALCLAESLVERGGMDPADQLDRYLRWRDHGHLSSTGRCFDIGTQTSAALDRYRRDGVVDGAAGGIVDEEAAANGSLMRLAPVPLRFALDEAAAIEAAAASSRTTHPARRPVDACRYYASLIVGALAGQPKEVLLAPGWWQGRPLHPEVAAVAAGSFRDREPPAIRGRGYVVACLEAALWALDRTATFRDGALAAANLGDDADTTAAVYGQLAGALYGEAGIPAAWRERLHDHDLIVALADALHAAAHGAPGPVEPVDAWWVRPGELLAGAYPAAVDQAATLDRLAALRARGVTAFVDLTEPWEAGLRPYAALLDGTPHHRHPIRDLDVPTDADLAAVLDLLDRLRDAGEVAYLHCRGGVGRTGTVVACHLVRGGATPADALVELALLRQRSARPDVRAPETAAQRALVARWAG